MNRKRSQLQAYFAGIFDGEGHVGIKPTTSSGGKYKTYTAVATLKMNDPQAVMLIAREYPEALTYASVDKYGKLNYQVYFGHHKAYRFLEEILPFLIIKHEQVKVTLSFLAHKRRDHAPGWAKGHPRGTRMPECLRCLRSEAALKSIRAEPKKVNSVNALLQHEMREYRAKPEEVAEDVRVMTSTMRELLEGVETRVSESNKPISAFEKEIVQQEAA